MLILIYFMDPFWSFLLSSPIIFISRWRRHGIADLQIDILKKSLVHVGFEGQRRPWRRKKKKKKKAVYWREDVIRRKAPFIVNLQRHYLVKPINHDDRLTAERRFKELRDMCRRFQNDNKITCGRRVCLGSAAEWVELGVVQGLVSYWPTLVADF